MLRKTRGTRYTPTDQSMGDFGLNSTQSQEKISLRNAWYLPFYDLSKTCPQKRSRADMTQEMMRSGRILAPPSFPLSGCFLRFDLSLAVATHLALRFANAQV